MQFHPYSNGPEISTFLFLWCDWALLSQTWTLDMVSERGRLPVWWCSSGQTLLGSSFFEDEIINANHIGIRPFGGFNYIDLIFIPHCNSIQPFPVTVESMKPDVVFNLLTLLWKTESSHCGNALKNKLKPFLLPQKNNQVPELYFMLCLHNIWT